MSLQSSKYLQYLNLSFNNLEGEVPNEGVFANITKQELQGNMRLCSKITSKWQLPSCHLSSSQGMSLVLKVTIAVAGFTFLIVLLGLAYILFYRKSKPVKVASSESFRAVHKRVSYEELSVATDKFNPTNFLGGGGFGSVFKGCLRDGTVVAVKVLNLEKHGASKSFFVECDALRSIRHRNLVKLITSCLSTDFNNTDFKALVYEFMPNGSLEEWLHPPENSSHGIQLDLSQRLNIAIDVASALDYLHNDCSTPIVHRDLKPSNVLLDQDMTARVGDFGLARLQDTEPSDCHQSTTFNLKGTIGYIAPEYGISGMTSTKADVFSFGVLLLELFTRKKPTDDMFTGEVSLPKWVSVMFPHRILDILDPELLNPISNGMASIRPKDEESWKFCIISLFEICLACTSESLEKRMNIRDVLPKLKKIRDNQFQC
ncbi:hypothetical protein AMTR_s00120p00057080 [Amborella trichopoda]|uniref:non-specific serine/threonine protein kinase n=2 Tax=Amborella trichopoda TaxID=13333 RepID=W1NSZ8_AMBTC|nr:hypothetical protein AMTR_s00120p00057080 [Amborella trichopoda]